ncbi:MAG TPA: FixH family protein [Meiothermus sp.]|nr:FixH family protein [Meiothermus sp.]
MTNSSVKPYGKKSNVWKWVFGILGGVFLVFAVLVGYMIWRMNYVPAGLDYSTTQTTANGLYRVSYSSGTSPIPINKLHTWTLHVETPQGQPVEDAQIALDGDMPQHGHGLPTRPQVTLYQGGGNYLVEGVKFQMGGWWVMDFTVSAGGKTDTVRFNLLLK